MFSIRHYHHIDRNRNNNNIWNLIPLSYNDHIVEIHTKNNAKIKKQIYLFMIQKFPKHEEHYRKNLLEENNEKNKKTNV